MYHDRIGVLQEKKKTNCCHFSKQLAAQVAVED